MQDNTKPGIKKHDHMDQQRLIIIVTNLHSHKSHLMTFDR